jgi:LmbE family N-acetylglucosaminyl deacetylase/acylphosphatase
MSDWDYKDRPDVFGNVPLDVVAERIAALIRQYRPQVLVTYDDQSGYDHPDHLHAARAAVAAARSTGIPDKVYLIAYRESRWRDLARELKERGISFGDSDEEWEEPSPEADLRMRESEARITTTVDIHAVLDRKGEALRTHASQIDDSWFSKIPEDIVGKMFGEETFIRAVDKTGTDPGRRPVRHCAGLPRRSGPESGYHARGGPRRCFRRAMRRDEGAPRERGGKAGLSSGPERAASTVSQHIRTRIRVTGTVQGDGFRPFVYALAVRLGLAGLVGNDAAGVFAEVEGLPAAVDEFLATLTAGPPPLARIDQVTTTSMPPGGPPGFTIVASDAAGPRTAQVSPTPRRARTACGNSATPQTAGSATRSSTAPTAARGSRSSAACPTTGR